MDAMDPNFGLITQGRIVSCPGDICNGDEIQKRCFSILIYKV